MPTPFTHPILLFPTESAPAGIPWRRDGAPRPGERTLGPSGRIPHVGGWRSHRPLRARGLGIVGVSAHDGGTVATGGEAAFAGIRELAEPGDVVAGYTHRGARRRRRHGRRLPGPRRRARAHGRPQADRARARRATRGCASCSCASRSRPRASSTRTSSRSTGPARTTGGSSSRCASWRAASLQDLIAEAPEGLPPGRAARIVARVADALDAAHARGLVHRDVKPANVLIADPDGEEHVYLTDFGPRASTGVGRRRGARRRAGPGRSAYLAPEQIRGEPLDARTDVYALGCVLFHALTGRPPFPTGDEQARARGAPPRPRPRRRATLVPGLPPAFDEVVRRAMAKRPEDRFPSAGELGRAALAARYDVALLLPHADDGPAAARLGDRPRARRSSLPLRRPRRRRPRRAEGMRASGACAVLVGERGLGDWAREALAPPASWPRATAPSAWCSCCCRGRRSPATRASPTSPPSPGSICAPGSATPTARRRPGARAARRRRRRRRAAAEDRECPYRGLEAFARRTPSLFFGREQDVARLVERLRATPLRRRARALGQRQELAGAGRPAARAAPRRPAGQRALARSSRSSPGEPGRSPPSPPARPAAARRAAPRSPAELARRRARPRPGRRPRAGRAAPTARARCWWSTSSRRSSRSAPTRASARPSSATSCYAATIPGGRAVVRRRPCAPTSTTALAEHPEPARAGRRPARSWSARSDAARRCGAPSRSRPAARPGARARAHPAHPRPTSPTARGPCRCSSTCCWSSGAAARDRTLTLEAYAASRRASRARSPGAPTRSTAR